MFYKDSLNLTLLRLIFPSGGSNGFHRRHKIYSAFCCVYVENFDPFGIKIQINSTPSGAQRSTPVSICHGPSLSSPAADPLSPNTQAQKVHTAEALKANLSNYFLLSSALTTNPHLASLMLFLGMVDG